MEQLVELETANLAKEKGFCEDTPKVYVETLEHTLEMGRGGDCTFPYQSPRILDKGNFDDWDIFHCNAPTQTELQRWLREIKFVYVNVQPIIYTGELKASYYQPLINQSTISIRKKYDTWEEALEEGLKEALKLIKIN
jgi:hypothetical protein